jgi:hypothetical protein
MDDTLGPPEIQIGDIKRPSPTTEISVQAQDEMDRSLGVSKLSPEIESMVQRMMAGTEPYGCELRPQDVRKFTPLHVQIVMLRIAGFKGSEIARITGAAKQLVYFTILHPYAKKLLYALVPQGSARVIDIRSRLDEYASELLDHVFSLSMQSNELEDVSKVTFGMLDRAGFSPKQDTPSKSSNGTLAVVPESTMSRLLSALQGSEQINGEVMSSWVPRRPPDEGALTVPESASVLPEVAPLSDNGSAPAIGSQPLRAAGGDR